MWRLRRWSSRPVRGLMRRRARELHRNATRAERVLFDELRRALAHKRVVLQHPVSGVLTGHAIIDIAILPDRIGIEVDGRHHRLPHVAARDRWRTFRLELGGWRILRVPNRTAIEATWSVVDRIVAEVEGHGGPGARR